MPGLRHHGLRTRGGRSLLSMISLLQFGLYWTDAGQAVYRRAASECVPVLTSTPDEAMLYKPIFHGSSFLGASSYSCEDVATMKSGISDV